MKILRGLLVAGVACLAFASLVLWVFTREEVGSRLMCSDGRVCTEYFSLKDGLGVRWKCPSVGHEQYGLPESCERIGDGCRCH